jgi:hypothetical protein
MSGRCAVFGASKCLLLFFRGRQGKLRPPATTKQGERPQPSTFVWRTTKCRGWCMAGQVQQQSPHGLGGGRARLASGVANLPLWRNSWRTWHGIPSIGQIGSPWLCRSAKSPQPNSECSLLWSSSYALKQHEKQRDAEHAFAV